MKYRASLVGLGLSGVLAGCLVPNPLHMVEDGAGLSGSGGTGGTGGTAGSNTGATAGQAGVGGSLAGTGGDSGTAGNSGTSGSSMGGAGTGGTGQAGTAGSSAMGGSAGTSGSAGNAGTGAMPGGSAGTSGTGATSGMAGTGGTGGSVVMADPLIRLGVFSPDVTSGLQMCLRLANGDHYSLGFVGISQNLVSGYYTMPAGTWTIDLAEFGSNCNTVVYTVPELDYSGDTAWTVVVSAPSVAGAGDEEIFRVQDRLAVGNEPALRAVRSFTSGIGLETVGFDVVTYTGWAGAPVDDVGPTTLLQGVDSTTHIAKSTSAGYSLDSLGYVESGMYYEDTFSVELRPSDYPGTSPPTFFNLIPPASSGLLTNYSLFWGLFGSSTVLIVCDDAAAPVNEVSVCKVTTVHQGLSGSYVSGAQPAYSASIRFANFSLHDSAIDVCLRSIPGEWRGGASQVMWSNIAYTQSDIVKRSLPPGSYELAFVPTGTGCPPDGAAVLLKTITIGAEEKKQLALMSTAASIQTRQAVYVSFDDSVTTNTTKIRFINTFSGESGVVPGLTLQSSLWSSNWAVGPAPAAGVAQAGGSVLEGGYISLSSWESMKNIKATDGNSQTFTTMNQYFQFANMNGHSYSVYGAGVFPNTNPTYPTNLYFCRDDSTPPSGPICVLVQ